MDPGEVGLPDGGTLRRVPGLRGEEVAQLASIGTGAVQVVYEQPIYPKNLYLTRRPYTHAEYRRDVTEPQIQKMLDRGIWKRPARAADERATHDGPAASGSSSLP